MEKQLDRQLIDSADCLLQIVESKLKIYTYLSFAITVGFIILFSVFISNMILGSPIPEFIILLFSTAFLSGLIFLPAYYFASLIIFLISKSYGMISIRNGIETQGTYVYEDGNFQPIYSISKAQFHRLSLFLVYISLLLIWTGIIALYDYLEKNTTTPEQISSFTSNIQQLDLLPVVADIILGIWSGSIFSGLDNGQMMMVIRYLPMLFTTYLSIHYIVKVIESNVKNDRGIAEIDDYWYLMYRLSIELVEGKLADRFRNCLFYLGTSSVITLIYSYVLYFIFL